jgi:RimJ/RimL family protein N-acetyltransferase
MLSEGVKVPSHEACPCRGCRPFRYLIQQSCRMNSISIRALNPAEWAALRDLRLHALQVAPGVFASSYEVEVTRTPEQWQSEISGPAHQIFGLFDEGKLIGITAVFSWREDPSGASALLAMSFIQPEYRGRGLSRLLYKARLDWIRTRPQFKRVVIYHRASNDPSRRAIERHGFRPARRASRLWPDGTTEDEIFYELPISD